ncbi:MAG TPA: head GIN domain-containing protein [Bacteroidales bacterium]|nr:head GIN domain-containing protein [Bacteroidales bacterium]
MKKTCCIIFSIFFFISSCKKENLCDCFKSTGKIVTEERKIRDFSSIFVSDNVNLILTQDSGYHVKVEAGEHLISLITTELRHDSLFIENKNRCNWVRSYKPQVNVYISLPVLYFFQNAGCGTIITTNTFTGDSLRFYSLNSSGDLTVKMDVKKCYLTIHTGCLNVNASGKTDYLDVYYCGNGMIHCENVNAKNTIVTNKSTGDIYVNVSESLYYIITWTGNIYYYGNPTLINWGDTGDGELIKL